MIAVALASSPPALPGFLNALSSPLQHYGVWAIGLLIMLEDFGIPVPGETILIAGAVYAGAGRLNVLAVGVVGFIAAIIGDNIGFAIGHFGGRALALRWGKYVFLTEERLNKAEDFFDRRGAIVITFARFVEGLRQANGIIAGITGMHWLRFLIFNAIGAALWVGTWVSLGYLAGDHIGTIYHYITLYSYYALIALAVLIVGYIVWRLRRRRRRLALAVASQASEAHESRTTGEAAGVMPDKPEAAEAAPGTHLAEAVPDTNQAAGPAPDNQEVTRAPGKHEAVQAAPDDEAAGPAPTEHAAGRHAADRHEPDTS
jgi:membrane protein DedA with SNARE-associated domain